jgi:hypothetical protein
VIAHFALALAASFAPTQEGTSPPPRIGSEALPAELDAESARIALERAYAWLLDNQNPDGSFAVGVLDGLLEMGFSIETYYAWQVASHALAVMALQAAEPRPDIERALERAVEWLCTTRMPKRGSDWDVDYVWSGLYGLVATTRLAHDARFADGPVAQAIAARGRAFADILVKNEVPSGGWAYYDDPPFTQRPKWATSFCTALVLPSVRDALELGWLEDRAILTRAIRAVRRTALPNGAFTYNADESVPRFRGGEHIDSVKGSLGRIQVCHFGLASVGDERITQDRIRWGLERFFTDHRFLRVAHGRPVPHEAYYYNAGYFYLFAHYYAAEVIGLLEDRAERERWHARLRPYLVEAQSANGSAVDFLTSAYMRVAGTAYLALALSAGLDSPDR